MAKTVTLYTSPGCPDCAALKAWLASHGVAYAGQDLSQPGVADKARAELGVRVAPITVCDGQVLYGRAQEQVPRLRDMLGLE